MVATRRSGANTASISNNVLKATKRRRITNTSTAEKSGKPNTVKSSVSRNPSPSTNSTAPSKPSSELDSLPSTTTPTNRTSEGCPPTIPDVSLHKKAETSTDQVVAVLQELIKPGTSHNPIIVTENSPPSNVRAKASHSIRVNPHRFRDIHSKLYTYKSSRPVLAPKLVSGSAFTGHQSHDMYRMHTARMAQPTWNMGRAPNDHRSLPFEVQYPMSAQYLAPKQACANPRPHIHYYASHPPMYRQLPTEEQLRSEAVKHIRVYSRFSSCKRKSVEDSDETSESESQEIDPNTADSSHRTDPARSFSSAIRSREKSFTALPNPYIQLTPLIEHTSLLTSLLREYPQSADQKGLREDITLLASVQNQHLTDWMNSEVGQSRKQVDSQTPCVSRNTISSPVKLLASRLTEEEQAETERKRKQDDEIRCLLSADAKLWQDGSGLGVADVYTVTRASTPTASHEEECKNNGAAAIVSASSPARCAAKAPDPSPEQGTTLTLPAVEARSKASDAASEDNMPGSLPATTDNVEGLVTPSPRVARNISAPAVRTSGRKRQAPARFRTE